MADFDKLIKIGLGALGVKPDKDFSVSDFSCIYNFQVDRIKRES